MKKLIIYSILVVIFTAGNLVFLCSHTGYARSLLLKDARNNVDPVTGVPIESRRFSTGYRGTRYWFDNYSNIREFRKDPEKYLRNLEALEAEYQRNPEEYKKKHKAQE